MSELRFILQPEFYREFRQRLERGQQVLNNYFAPFNAGESMIDYLPTLQEMELLIENVLWASVEREEGRSLQFNVGLFFSHPKIFGFYLKSV